MRSNGGPLPSDAYGLPFMEIFEEFSHRPLPAFDTTPTLTWSPGSSPKRAPSARKM